MLSCSKKEASILARFIRAFLENEGMVNRHDRLWEELVA